MKSWNCFVEKLTSQDIRARVDHSTSWQVFIIRGVFSSVQFIHDHLPNCVRACRACLEISMATMRHTEVHSVWPQWWVVKGSCDGRVVEECLLFHHCELIVATDSQVWRTKTDNGIVCDVCELLDNDSLSSHFFRPCVNSGIRPESFVIIVTVRDEKN